MTRARWRLIPAREEHVNGDVYYLQSVRSQRVLTVQNDIYLDNRPLRMQPLEHAQRQRFVIHRVGHAIDKKKVEKSTNLLLYSDIYF